MPNFIRVTCSVHSWSWTRKGKEFGNWFFIFFLKNPLWLAVHIFAIAVSMFAEFDPFEIESEIRCFRHNGKNCRPIHLCMLGTGLKHTKYNDTYLKYVQCAILALRLLSELHREFSRPLHVAYVDLKAAFDLMDHLALWKALRGVGAPRMILSLIEDLHSSITSWVRLGGVMSDSFFWCSRRLHFGPGPILSSYWLDLRTDSPSSWHTSGWSSLHRPWLCRWRRTDGQRDRLTAGITRAVPWECWKTWSASVMAKDKSTEPRLRWSWIWHDIIWQCGWRGNWILLPWFHPVVIQKKSSWYT